MNPNKILDSVKDYLLVTDNSYDDTILNHINTVIFGLYQLGVIQMKTITKNDLWSDLNIIGNGLLPIIKQIIFLRVKILFDPNPSLYSIIMQSIEEYESRCVIETDIGQNSI